MEGVFSYVGRASIRLPGSRAGRIPWGGQDLEKNRKKSKTCSNQHAEIEGKEVLRYDGHQRADVLKENAPR